MHQGVEVAALVQLGVHAGLLQLLDAHLGNHRVRLGILHHVLHQGQGLGHVLAQAAQGDSDVACADTDVIVAGEFVELLLDFLVGHLVGAEVFEVLRGHVIAQVGFITKLITEGQHETSVLLVLHINVRQTSLGVAEGEVFLEVDETGLDGGHFAFLNFLDEVADEVAVGRDGGDGRLVNLLLVFVYTLTLVNHHIVVVEVLVGEGHDVIFRQVGDAVEAANALFPRHLIDIGVDEHIGTGHVALHRVVVVQLGVVDDRRQQVVGEVAALQFLDFGNHQVFGFLKGLARTR